MQADSYGRLRPAAKVFKSPRRRVQFAMPSFLLPIPKVAVHSVTESWISSQIKPNPSAVWEGCEQQNDLDLRDFGGLCHRMDSYSQSDHVVTSSRGKVDHFVLKRELARDVRYGVD